MGIGFGAGSSAISYHNTAKVGKALHDAGAGDALVSIGQTMKDGSQAKSYASELARQTKITDAELGKLYILITEQAAADGMTTNDLVAQVRESHESDYAAIVANAEAPALDGGGGSPVPSQTDTKPETESPYNSTPTLDLTDITDIDIRPHELLAAQAPDLATITKLDAKTPTINTPKSTPSQSNGGGGDPDAPRQTTAQTEFDRKLANVIEASNAGVEGRRPELIDSQTSMIVAEPTVAKLIEAFNAGMEGRKYAPKDITARIGIDHNLKSEYNQNAINFGNNSDQADNEASRNMNGLRKSPFHILTDAEIDLLKNDAKALGIPIDILKFNEGEQTGMSDRYRIIYVRGDVLPDSSSTHIRDKLSQKAVLAHEYYGHYKYHPSKFRVGDWRDEFRASYSAATEAPGLTEEERWMLMMDAYDRAKEAGVRVIYNKKARRIIYGYDD